MSEPACSMCIYWSRRAPFKLSQIEEKPITGAGTCRRYPPVGGPTTTNQSYWCGEFRHVADRPQHLRGLPNA